ncbi:hypothetical protein NQ176_g7736 [Zarea fungicola]|uniref:Uncharacterized protein n=1 Tax=Zarea fungicola TaxID=93591 RepID=A0ACC1MYW2_9HYPO|nr:hypothetical protein NQ176_g7736 [Lecanicillium fungicola]
MTQPSIGAQASRLAKDFTLNGASRTRMPKLVYGTAWKKDATANLVYMALKAGFRGIDTAAQPKHYHEQGVAAGFKQALTEGIVKREDVFVSHDALHLGSSGPWDIQTKFTPPAGQNQYAPYDFNAPLEEKVHQSVLSSLNNFTIQGQETYLDSVVIHSPLASMSETMTVWKTLETYHPHKIRNLGISNATLNIVEALYAAAVIKPSVVQNRFYADTHYEAHLRGPGIILPFVTAPLIYFSARDKFMTVFPGNARLLALDNRRNVSQDEDNNDDQVSIATQEPVKMANSWFTTGIAVLVWLFIAIMNVANLVFLGQGES